MTSNKEYTVDQGKVGVLMVGGGGQGYRSKSGGASGYWNYKVVDVLQDKARIVVEIGGGGNGVSGEQS